MTEDQQRDSIALARPTSFAYGHDSNVTVHSANSGGQGLAGQAHDGHCRSRSRPRTYRDLHV
jgi:hypothetical protein